MGELRSLQTTDESQGPHLLSVRDFRPTLGQDIAFIFAGAQAPGSVFSKTSGAGWSKTNGFCANP